jgi:endonuclease YncB( thermonuclease family)
MKKTYFNYPVPHLIGRIDYSGQHKFDPDGDTVHLRDPLLLVNGNPVSPQNGRFTIWMPGNLKPKFIHVKGSSSPYVPIRFEGIDAPEEHYRATPFVLKKDDGSETKIEFDPQKQHDERSQSRWKPATEYLLDVLQRVGWALVTLDREVTDRYGRVLGYVYASDGKGRRGRFMSLELVKRGLAFPFLFESAGDLIPMFLNAANHARAASKGVWRHYVDRPLTYKNTYPRPARYTQAEPAIQANGRLNLPVVFRRIVDAEQLKGLSLADALRKYDAIDYGTGVLVPGDRYNLIPIERRIWAPHRYDTP